MENEKHYKFFQNRECEYFPCHKTDHPEDFSCLFCYCPLYALGRRCKGNFSYKGDVKVCTNCMIPHRRENYDYIIGRYREIVEIVRLADREGDKNEKPVDQ